MIFITVLCSLWVSPPQDSSIGTGAHDIIAVGTDPHICDASAVSDANMRHFTIGVEPELQ